MTIYLSNASIDTDLFPRFYRDANTIYTLVFAKAAEEVANAIVTSPIVSRFMYSNTEAESFLLLDTIKTTVLANTSGAKRIPEIDVKGFRGYQIGSSANDVFFLRSVSVFDYNPNNSLYADGTKGLQLWRVRTSSGGIVGTPTRWTLEPSKDIFARDEFTDTLLDVAVGLDNGSLDNALVVFYYNTTWGYWANESANVTSNVASSLVSYFPKISVSGDTSINASSTANITLTLTYSNGAAYPSTNTKVFVTSHNGTTSKYEVNLNSVANVKVGSSVLLSGLTVDFSIGWEYYSNVVSANLNVTTSSGLPAYPAANADGFYFLTIANGVQSWMFMPTLINDGWPYQLRQVNGAFYWLGGPPPPPDPGP